MKKFSNSGQSTVSYALMLLLAAMLAIFIVNSFRDNTRDNLGKHWKKTMNNISLYGDHREDEIERDPTWRTYIEVQ